MARADNAYSRFVAWVKIILPVMALLLLSSLFLFQPPGGDQQPLPFTAVELAELATGQGIGRPEFKGLSGDGRAITLTADSALPRLRNRQIIDVTGVDATMDTPEHLGIRLRSASGLVDRETSVATLTGSVRAETGSGYTLETEALRVALSRSDIQSPGPVSIRGPGLSIDAGQMHLHPKEAESDPTILVFKEGVRLIYIPGER